MADQAAKPAHSDITSEQYRDYVYPDGGVFRITAPIDLYIVNGSHRVVDEKGVTHRPERGYVGIRWAPKPGFPPFAF